MSRPYTVLVRMPSLAPSAFLPALRASSPAQLERASSRWTLRQARI